jgi:anti-sigma factor RsiW
LFRGHRQIAAVSRAGKAAADEFELMNACATNRKALALLAIDALEAPEAGRLRAHLESCAGCRDYLREIEQVAAKVSAAEAPPDMDASPFLHRRVRNRLLETRPRPVFPWRLLIPALAALMFVLFVFPRAPKVAPPPAPLTQAPVVNNINPTVLTYQIAANQSLDKLDAILTKQGNRALPAIPIYRADSLGNAAD